MPIPDPGIKPYNNLSTLYNLRYNLYFILAAHFCTSPDHNLGQMTTVYDGGYGRWLWQHKNELPSWLGLDPIFK